MQHRGAEILEIGDVLLRLLPHGLREIDPTPLHDDVDVGARAAEEAVAHEAADHERTPPPLGSYLADDAEDRTVKKLGGYRGHSISS